MELKVKERKLLYLLDKNSRLTNKALGKEIGLSEQGVGKMLKRLEEKEIIQKYVTFVNTPLLGYDHYKVLIRFHDVNPKKEKEIIKDLVTNKNIRWVVSCTGKWDINFSIIAKTPQEFSQIYRKIEEKYGKFITEKDVSLLIKSPGFPKKYLQDKNINEKVLDYGTENKEIKLDEKDKQILKSISQNARKKIIDIASEVKLSTDAVIYRIKKMQTKKVINGYTLKINHKKIGIKRYSVFFQAHNFTEVIERSMINFCKKNKFIVFFLVMIGKNDFSLELEVPNEENLEETIKAFREEFSNNIRDFEVIHNTEEFKFDFYSF